MSEKEWFAEWFDSKYYHILYQHRDDKEAQRFLTNLINEVGLDTDQRLLDLACGKGRHARFLNAQGFDVVGVDLSAESIEYARKFENERLHFDVHDMREALPPSSYDVILNLFTSFGYFESMVENLQVLGAVRNALKPAGKIVIDFMNVERVLANLVEQEEKQLDGITFYISRALEDGRIVKDITFHADERDWHFTEQVQALKQTDFEALFDNAGLRIINTFGDYDLNAFDSAKSDRLIYVLETATVV